MSAEKAFQGPKTETREERGRIVFPDKGSLICPFTHLATLIACPDLYVECKKDSLVNSSVGSVFFGRRLDPFLREFVCVVKVLGEVE